MSGLLSLYVDLCLVYIPTDINREGREMCGFVAYILGRWPEMCLEVVLQLCAIRENSGPLLLPLIRRSLSTKPVTDGHYLKYVILVRIVKDKLGSDMATEFIVPAMNIPAQRSFFDWLRDLCPEVVDMMPTKCRKFKGRKVTRYLVEEADEDAITMLLDSLRDPDGIEDIPTVLEVQTDGAGETPTAGTSAGADSPLFYIDTLGGKQGVSTEEQKMGEDFQDESDASSIVVDTLRDIEQLIDNEENTKTYKLSDSLMKNLKVNTAEEFIKEGIVSITTMKPDSLEKDDQGWQDDDEDTGTLVIEISDTDLPANDSENKITANMADEEVIKLESDINEAVNESEKYICTKVPEEDIIDLDSDLEMPDKRQKTTMFVEMETESELSCTDAEDHAGAKKTKLKSIVTKVTPMKEAKLMSEETTASSISMTTDTENEYDPSEPTISGIDNSASTVDNGDLSESTNVAESEIDETGTEAETDDTSKCLISSFDSDGTVKGTAKSTNVISDSDVNTGESQHQTKSPVLTEIVSKNNDGAKGGDIETYLPENVNPNKRKKKSIDMSKHEKMSRIKSHMSASSTTSELGLNKIGKKQKRSSSSKNTKSDSSNNSDTETSNNEVFLSPRSSPRKGQGSLRKDFSSTSSFGSAQKVPRKNLSSSENGKADHEEGRVLALSFMTPPAMKSDSSNTSDTETSNNEVFVSPRSSQRKGQGSLSISEGVGMDGKDKSNSASASSITETDIDNAGAVYPHTYSSKISADFSSTSSFGSAQKVPRKKLLSSENGKADYERGRVLALSFKTPPAMKAILHSPSKKKAHMHEAGLVTEEFIVNSELQPNTESSSLKDKKKEENDISNDAVEKQQEADSNDIQIISSPENLQKKQTPSKNISKDIQDKFITKAARSKTPRKKSGSVGAENNEHIECTAVENGHQSSQRPKKLTPQKMSEILNDTKKNGNDPEENKNSNKKEMEQMGLSDSGLQKGEAHKRSKSAGAVEYTNVKISKSKKRISSFPDTLGARPDSEAITQLKRSSSNIAETGNGKKDGLETNKRTPVKVQLEEDELQEKNLTSRKRSSDSNAEELEFPINVKETPSDKNSKKLNRNSETENENISSEADKDMIDVQVKKSKTPTKTPEYIRQKKSDSGLTSPENDQRNVKNVKETPPDKINKKTLNRNSETEKENISSEADKDMIDVQVKKSKTPKKTPAYIKRKKSDSGLTSPENDQRNVKNVFVLDSDTEVDFVGKQEKKDTNITFTVLDSSEDSDVEFPKKKNIKTPQKIKSPDKADIAISVEATDVHTKMDGTEPTKKDEKNNTSLKSPTNNTHSTESIKSDSTAEIKPKSVDNKKDHEHPINARNSVDSVKEGGANKDNEISLGDIQKSPKLSTHKHESIAQKTDIVIHVPSSQKKVNKKSEAESSEFTQLRTKINVPSHTAEDSDSGTDVVVVPNLSQHLKSPHVPVVDGEKEEENNKKERRSLRPRRQSVMESESETDVPQKKSGRSRKQDVPVATTPAAKKKKPDRNVSIASTVDEIISETSDADSTQSTRVTRRKSVLLKTLKTPPQRALSKERKLSASTSKKVIRKAEQQKTTMRKRRLSGEMLASGKDSNRSTPETEVSFPKLKKVPKARPASPEATKTTKRASTAAAKKGTEPKAGPSGARSGYSLRKK